MSSGVVIHVEGGKVEGVTGKDPAIHVFRGIPYARPPVGALRWRAPEPEIGRAHV